MKTESIERGVHHCWSIPSWCGISHGTKSGFLNPYITLTGETHHIYINYCLKNTLMLNECTTIFIEILNCKNDLVWLMMSSTFSLFFLQVLEKLNLEVLDFRVFSELAILECFFDLAFQTFPVCTQFQRCGNFYVTVLSKCVWKIFTITRIVSKTLMSRKS